MPPPGPRARGRPETDPTKREMRTGRSYMRDGGAAFDGRLDRRLGAIVATAAAVGGGLISDLFAARGPITPFEGIVVMTLALTIGVVGGALTRSRWVLPLLGMGYIVGVELGRSSLPGASLAVRLDNTYGIIAFVLARGLHGVLVLVPLSLGMRVARGGGSQSRGRPIGSSALGIATVGLALLVMWPASTPAVTTPDGRPIAGSIAELARVPVGGSATTVMIRAASADRPVILWLAGGPGQSDLALARAQVSGWEQDFVFAALDQRGNGTSYAAIDPTSSMTLDRAV